MFERADRSDALLIVDVQRDFLPGGALAVPQADAVLGPLNRALEAARRREMLVVLSRDWHPPDHCSFQSVGGVWPEHCVQGTAGAELSSELAVPAVVWLVSKGTDRCRECYSAFDGTRLAERLRQAGVMRLWLGGLALDYCVKATALDARREGFAVHLLLEATRPVEAAPGDGQRAVDEMVRAGVVLDRGGSTVR